ncbi:MAG: FAD-dependent monooxygenase [Gammaproteobacteria bacterium]|nr:FAD-dependent monooxygenase [Gammaproteobacteria bacterium]
MSESAARPGDYDILIAGAGAVGASLACALAGSASRVGIIEAVPLAGGDRSTHDGRGLALSLGTRQKLAASGVWPLLDAHANPIEHIHVSHRGHFGAVHLDAARLGLPALGYVVPALRLGRALLDRIGTADNIDLICPARLVSLRQDDDRVRVMLDEDGERRELNAALLVGADGSRSRVRELCAIGTSVKDYGHTAIVSSVQPAEPHNNTAYERFTDSGPLALLPLRDGRCVSVCCFGHDAAAGLMAQSDAVFLGHAGTAFRRPPGSFLRAR